MWLSITTGILAGKLPFADYQLPLAILMGGTVVGIAYKKEVGRVSVMSAGFVFSYLAIKYISWTVLGIEIVVLGIVAYVYFAIPMKNIKTNTSIRAKEIEEKLKNCC